LAASRVFVAPEGSEVGLVDEADALLERVACAASEAGSETDGSFLSCESTVWLKLPVALVTVNLWRPSHVKANSEGTKMTETNLAENTSSAMLVLADVERKRRKLVFSWR
jgi:hypothetical protein